MNESDISSKGVFFFTCIRKMTRSSSLGILSHTTSTPPPLPVVNEVAPPQDTWKKRTLSLVVVGGFVVAGIIVGIWAGMNDAFKSSE